MWLENLKIGFFQETKIILTKKYLNQYQRICNKIKNAKLKAKKNKNFQFKSNTSIPKQLSK